MENKILKNGTLVYNKNHGQGLIWCYKPNKNIYDIVFEGYNTLVSLGRESLFVKGDRVYYKNKDCNYSFEGYSAFLNKPFAVKDIEGGYLFYLNDINHSKEEPTIEITVKVNGREVPLNTLSMDTLEKIRAMETP